MIRALITRPLRDTVTETTATRVLVTPLGIKGFHVRLYTPTTYWEYVENAAAFAPETFTLTAEDKLLRALLMLEISFEFTAGGLGGDGGRGLVPPLAVLVFVAILIGVRTLFCLVGVLGLLGLFVGAFGTLGFTFTGGSGRTDFCGGRGFTTCFGGLGVGGVGCSSVFACRVGCGLLAA